MAFREMYALDTFDDSPLTLGWLPLLSFADAAGLFVLALADIGGRASAVWADPLFWIGLLIAFVPTAVRILSGAASRNECIILLLLLGSVLYLQKVLQYPLGFAYNDEFQSLRTALDITNSGHLFHPNPTLAVGPAYPGLEIVANAASSLSGLPLFPTVVVILGVVRLIQILALFLVYEKVSRSTRLAAIATLLFTAEPGFTIGSGQFAYSSFGIPLALFVLYTVVSLTLRTVPREHRKGLLLIAILGLGALTATHHLTSFFLAAFLLLWFVLTLRDQAPDSHIWLNRAILGVLSVLSLILPVVWLVVVGRDIVLGYLVHPAVETAGQLIQVLLGRSSGRLLFQSTGDLQVVPVWEQLVGLASAAVALIAQMFGLYLIWQRHRANVCMLALAVSSLLYPLSLVVRYTPVGASIASRATEYAFFPLALVLALSATAAMDWLRRSNAVRVLPPVRTLSRAAPACLLTYPVTMATVASVLFLGGIVVGAGQTFWHTPGPYIAAANMRSISQEGIDAALWTSVHVGPNQRLAGDLVDRLLMASYGGQWVVPDPTGPGDANVDSIFFSPHLGPAQEATLRRMRIRLLVVDLRFSNGLPASGFYFDGAEPGAYQHTVPINPRYLTKFDSLNGVSRLFDSGNIVIYDTGVLDGKS